jgi:hypothetical protein
MNVAIGGRGRLQIKHYLLAVIAIAARLVKVSNDIGVDSSFDLGFPARVIDDIVDKPETRDTHLRISCLAMDEHVAVEVDIFHAAAKMVASGDHAKSVVIMI